MVLLMWLVAVLVTASAVGHGAAAAATTGALCDGAKHPIIILPGMTTALLWMKVARYNI